MDSVEVEVPVPEWKSQLLYAAETLRNTTRWALACPRPKKKSLFFFGTQEEPEIDASWFRLVSETITTTIVTFVAAWFLLYIVDYFVQFCYSLGIVLSGRDCITPTHSRPGSPNHSAPPSPPNEQPGKPPAPMVKMNQPVDCVARTPTTISLATTSRSRESSLSKTSESRSATGSSSWSSTKAKSSNSKKNTDSSESNIREPSCWSKAKSCDSKKSADSSESNKSMSKPEPRLHAGADAVFAVAQNAFFDFDDNVPVATVFGGTSRSGKLETVGSLELDKPGKVNFVWLQENANVSITGTFFGYKLSVPLQKEKTGDWPSFMMTMPVGKYEYEFVIEGKESSEESLHE